MQWLSAAEAEAKIEALPAQDALFEAYALSLFADRAHYSADFRPSEAWAEMVVPTDAGQEMLRVLTDAGYRFSPHIQLFTLFRLFYYRDLFIDHQTTELDGILGLLRGIHTKASARWPYIFGNRLYHKFNDAYDGNRTESLEAEDADALLEDTPQGIFQVGRTLSGPLGFLLSGEERTIAPTLALPLWHCSDPGCQARHLVFLRQHKNQCESAKKTYNRHIGDHWGPPSEWGRAIAITYQLGRWPTGRAYSDIPAVIADCIIGPERSALCLRALRSSHNDRLTSALREANRSEGRPEDVVQNLSAEEQHQLLLVLPDKDLVRIIDELVSSKEIRIPPSEVRSQETKFYMGSTAESQISSLGVRSNAHPPLIELAASIWNTYETLGTTDKLVWRVRGHAGSTLRHSVMDFVKSRGPVAAVRELILTSRDVTTAIGEALTFSVYPEEPEETTCSRLLWKFGFNIPRYEEEYILLRTRIAQFREEVLKMSTHPSEDERATVRASGVNLFVSVEDFLENMLCYNVWLLGSDHFTGTKFLYTKQDGLLAVPRMLGGQIKSGDESLHWSTSGTNSIGVLLAYLHAFRAWLKGRSDADRGMVERKEADYPHYSKDTVWVFPFEHTELWADTTPEIMAAYTKLINEIGKQIAQADLTVVRNGMDHKREDNAFPSSDTMLACVSRLQQVVDVADSNRLVPKLYWATKSDRDADGNVSVTFSDYRGSTHSLRDPSPVLAQPRKTFAKPYLIAPFDFLDQPNSTLVFMVSQSTAYREYWKNYPRRRAVPPETTIRDENGIENDDLEHGN